MGDYPRHDLEAATRFYVEIIERLIRDISEAQPAPQWNWFAPNAPPLVQYLSQLRTRLLQGPNALSAADPLMLRWYNKVLLELSHDLEIYQGLKRPSSV